ncbi:MAG: sulfatase/phosphatase domain-containing protein [Planctomycetota bacterium]
MSKRPSIVFFFTDDQRFDTTAAPGNKDIITPTLDSLVREDETRDAFCYLIDIFPTLCELTGVPAPETVEGRSLAPVMANAAAPSRDSLIFAYTHLHRGARDKRWKLIEYVVDGKRTTQLFDLENDPFELNNRAGDSACAEHAERLSKQMLRWRDELGDTCDSFWRGYAAPQ